MLLEFNTSALPLNELIRFYSLITDISPVDQHQPYVSLIDCQATGVLLCQKNSDDGYTQKSPSEL